MVSVLILGVGLTSVANSYILALRGANTVGNKISALIIIKEKFENLELVSLKGAKPAFFEPEIIKSSNKDYNYQQEITKLPGYTDTETASDESASVESVKVEPDNLAKHLVLACLEVSWPEKNSSKNVTLATYLPRQK